MGEPDEKLEEARARLEGVARGLAARFGPEAACRLLAGTLVGLAVGSAGRVAAIEFLEDLVAQVREDHPENWPAGGESPASLN